MSSFRAADSKALWVLIESTAMGTAAWLMERLVDLAGPEQVGRSLAPATVLLSVAVAIVIQLWVKLNDLSALASLTPDERRRLWGQVRDRVRALVWLVIFFVSFIFFVLAVGALSATKNLWWSASLLAGAGAGFGASLALLGGVLVDLNEVAEFRWKVETSDIAARRRSEMVGELRTPDKGFEGDENIQGYKRVSGE
jgi:hypothetical protein